MTDRKRIAAHYDQAADREYQRLTQEGAGLRTVRLRNLEGVGALTEDAQRL